MKYLYVSAVLCLLAHSVVWAGILSYDAEDMQEIGEKFARKVEREETVVNDPYVREYMSKVGGKLARFSPRPSVNYSFKVLDSEEANAFAIPGGYLYFYTGLIERMETESEMAGVTAHEIAHITQQHGLEQLNRSRKAQIGLGVLGVALSAAGIEGSRLLYNGAQVVTNLVFLNYSRDQEAEADRVGVRTMYEAGWDPRGMVALFETLNEAKGARPPEFMSSHPAPGDRIQSIRAQINDWPRLDAKRQDAQAFHRFKRELRDQT